MRRRPIVKAKTPYPLIISGFGNWSERFEAGIRAAIIGAAPDAKIAFGYDYPDLDDLGTTTGWRTRSRRIGRRHRV